MNSLSGSNTQRVRTILGMFRVGISITILTGLALSLLFPIIGSNSAWGFGKAQAATDPVVAAAGDIACDPLDPYFNGGNGSTTRCHQKFTSNLLVNTGLTAVLDLGDDQYYCGSYNAFMQVYDPTWGRVKTMTHPAPGNHEYLTSSGTTPSTGCDSTNQGAAGYFKYFGSAAGTAGQGYYSYDIGTWHIIVLNSNCGNVGGCNSGSAQYTWLQNDLATHTNYCTLAYWHIPLFSSGGRATSNSKPFWQLLYNYDADLILSGHDHIYERFAPQDPTGAKDLAKGIREFVVGTGGGDHTGIPGALAANSEIHNTDTFGVLKLTLHSSSYDWNFVPEAGKTFTDLGTQNCHQNVPDTTAPSAPTNLSATAVAWNQVNLSWTPSIDNVGVTSYKIFRNGAQIGTTANTSYSDTTAKASTSYSYYVKAVDAAGNVSGASNTASATTPATPSSLTFTPTADAYVRSDLPTNNYGASTQLAINSSPTENTFLKFSVSGVGTLNIKSVKLRLYCVDSSPFGGEFRRATSSSWSESTINYSNAPGVGTTIYGTLGTVASGSWYEVDLTSAITGDGTYTIRIGSTSTDRGAYSSKEGTSGLAPQLVIFLGTSSATATPTPVPTSNATATPTPNATATATLPGPSPTPTATTQGPSATPTPTSTASAGQSVTFTPIADTYVNAGSPDTNYGSSIALRADGSPDVHSYLRFNVSGLNGKTIVRARLLLFANSSLSQGINALAIANNTWDELTTTYNNAPPLGNALSTSGPIATGSWVTLDVTSYITGEGTFSLGVNTASSTAVGFASRESGANSPQLILDLQ